MKPLVQLGKLVCSSVFIFHFLIPQSVFAQENLGQFWVTFYYVVDAKKYGNSKDKHVQDILDTSLAKVDKKFLKDTDREGTGWLRDGRVINFAKVIDGQIRYKETAAKFGDGIGRCSLNPYRTIAVDPDFIPFGTEVYIPQAVGIKLPDGTIHDGHFMAHDRGGMINDKHIDLFSRVGLESAKLFIDHGIETRTKVDVIKVKDADPNGCHAQEPHLTGRYKIKEGVASHLDALVELFDEYTAAQNTQALDYIHSKLPLVRAEWESMRKPKALAQYKKVWKDAEISKIEKLIKEGTAAVLKAKKSKTDNVLRINEYNGSRGLNPKEIVLTFDDGPHPVVTAQVLNTLLKENVPGAFFEVGEEVLKYSNITRLVAKSGFTLGNHSNTHTQLTKLSAQAVVAEIMATQNNLTTALGGGTSFDKEYFQPLFAQFFDHTRVLESPEFFRAPYGSRNTQVLQALYGVSVGKYQDTMDIKLKHIMWNIDSVDWKHEAQPAEIIDRVKAQLAMYGSGVVLFHDRVPATAIAIDRLIPELKAEGYRFVSVYDLIKKFGQP